VGGLIVSVFSERLFNSAIIKNIYQVDKAKLANPKNPVYEFDDTDDDPFSNTPKN